MRLIPDTKIYANINQLSHCYIKDENDYVIPAGDLWKNQTAVIVFLRHFACEMCRLHAAEVWQNRDMYEKKGAKIALIGNGDVSNLKKFKSRMKMEEAAVYTDPTLKTFDAAGFRRGFWVNPGSLHSRPEFIAKAITHTLKSTGSGNVWQLGGILVVKQNGAISYQYTSQTLDDIPPSSDVVPQMPELK